MPISPELLEPLPGESATGVSLRYEPIYEQIKQARIEDDDVPQGEWREKRRVADWTLVIRLASDALAKRSKDLQLAAWFTEAQLRKNGFEGLASGLELLKELLDRFWEGLYPEIDEGDLEYRAAPLEWVGQYLDLPVRATALTRGGHDAGKYAESRTIGYEAQAKGDTQKMEARKKAIAAGKLTAEEFDAAFNETPKSWYKKLLVDLDASRMALDALDAAAGERFGNVAPNFSKLRSALETVRQAAAPLLARKLGLEPDPVEVVPEPEPAEAAGEQTEEQPSATPSGGGRAAASAAVSAQPQSRDDAIGRIAGAARFLRAQHAADPAPYLLLRGLRWGELRAASPLDPKLLAAPPTDVRSRLKGLLLDHEWRQLLEQSEEVMAQPFGRGWLDLQRYVLRSCEALGAEFQPVSAAVSGALRTLLRDLPELPTLTLMDDTPTANAETRSWLRERGLLVGAEEEEEEVVAATNGAGRAAARDAAFDRVLERIPAGEPQRAVEMLLRLAEQEKSPRARFLRRAQAARVMVQSGFESVAMPLLQELSAQIEKHTLEDWESGETVAQTLGLMYRCLQKLEPNNSQVQQLYLRICRLDPMQAMQISSAAEADAPSA